MKRALVLSVAVLLCLPEPGLAASKARKAKGVERAKRTLKTRTLRITDGTGVAELHVAGGVPTSLSFLVDVDGEQVLLADSKNRFFDPQTRGRSLVLVPKQDLGPHEQVILQVVLADGTRLPFNLVTRPGEVDLAVDVELDLKKRSPPESVVALRASVAEVQARLDECQASAGEQGMGKVAALVLAQEPSKPEAFTVEKQQARTLDKQSRLLVETHAVYRLFDLSYLVLTLENRDPSQAWVLERAEVAVAGGASSSETRVVAVEQEVKVVAPGETVRMVVGFVTPTQESGHSFRLKLLEKGGARHVDMSF